MDVDFTHFTSPPSSVIISLAQAMFSTFTAITIGARNYGTEL